MTALPIYSTGTVSVTAAGTIVTGVGGAWTGINAKQGDFIQIANFDAVLITGVTDATHLTIPPWPNATQAAVTYKIYQNYLGRVVGVAAAEDVGVMLEKLHTDGLPFIVDTTETVPDPSYGDDGQLAFKPSTGQWWTKTAGVWVTSFPIGGNNVSGAFTVTHNSYDGITAIGSSSNAIGFRAHNNFAGSRKWNWGASGGGPASNGKFFLWDDTLAAVRLTVDGPSGDSAWFGGASWTSAGTASLGPVLTIEHTAAGALNNTVGTLNFKGKNAAGTPVLYGEITGHIFTTTAGAEDGYLDLKFRYNGILRQGATLIGYRSGASLEYVFHWFDNSSPQFYLESTNPAALGANTKGVNLDFWLDRSNPPVGSDTGLISFDGRNSAGAYQIYGQYYGGHIVSPTAGSCENLQTWTNIQAGDSFYMYNGIVVGGGASAPTGANKGTGTINCKAAYDDNSLLITCYVTEAAATGKVNFAYWDDLVPNTIVPEKPRRVIEADKRRGRPASIEEAEPGYTIVNTHGPLRKFAARLGTDHDPTTLAGQRKHLADKKHLTPYSNPAKFNESNRPSLGALLQSGVEMDYLLFTYIDQLEKRVAALEAKLKD